jgi:hypothetical protein
MNVLIKFSKPSDKWNFEKNFKDDKQCFLEFFQPLKHKIEFVFGGETVLHYCCLIKVDYNKKTLDKNIFDFSIIFGTVSYTLIDDCGFTILQQSNSFSRLFNTHFRDPDITIFNESLF